MKFSCPVFRSVSITLLKMSETDIELLERYTTRHCEQAFAEIVQRHLGLVYSAAYRQVRSPELAEEVTQNVFSDLARQAQRLRRDSVLSGWLYQVTHRAAVDVIRREARRQSREQTSYALALMNQPDLQPSETEWCQIEPILDEAMQELDEPERAAVLLRYFENKSLHEVGRALGTSEDAARKRVSRAIERLRGILGRRGVTAGAASLALALSAHAVQAAPATLAAKIIPLAALGAAAATSSSSAALIQTLTMTTLQKSFVATIILAALGTGFYQAPQISDLRSDNQALRKESAAQVATFQRERDQTRQEIDGLQQELARLTPAKRSSEVLQLRGQVGSLRQQLASSQQSAAAPQASMAKLFEDPAARQYMQKAMQEKLRSLFLPLFQELNLAPDQRDKVLDLLVEQGSQQLARMTSAAQGKPSTNESTDINLRLAEVLGPAGFTRYQEYGGEIPARSTISLLEAQLEGALTAEQNARLIQIIKAEPHELTQGVIGSPDPAFLGSETEAEAFLHRVEESNSRILQQASGVLEPKELAALNTVLTNAVGARKLQAAAWFKKP